VDNGSAENMSSKTYKIITFGCQMNEHDSEVISGMLAQRGYVELADESSDPDIMIINTCSIRENADKRFFGTLGQLKKIKARKPDAACIYYHYIRIR
jgi:tRNA-2-methylthio-N6-dimethylallyladenosine synthase